MVFITIQRKLINETEEFYLAAKFKARILNTLAEEIQGGDLIS